MTSDSAALADCSTRRLHALVDASTLIMFGSSNHAELQQVAFAGTENDGNVCQTAHRLLLVSE